jgi:small subunit ribosomal protein S6e
VSKEEAGVRLVIADPRKGRTKQIEIEDEKLSNLIGAKIGDKISGNPFGFPGYEFQITGGSSENGTPMRSDVHGGIRKKILVSKGPSYYPQERGLRRRKMVHGNMITDEIVQINLKVVEWGKKEIFEEKEEVGEKKEEKKFSFPIKFE